MRGIKILTIFGFGAAAAGFFFPSPLFAMAHFKDTSAVTLQLTSINGEGLGVARNPGQINVGLLVNSETAQKAYVGKGHRLKFDYGLEGAAPAAIKATFGDACLSKSGRQHFSGSLPIQLHIVYPTGESDDTVQEGVFVGDMTSGKAQIRFRGAIKDQDGRTQGGDITLLFNAVSFPSLSPSFDYSCP